MTPVSTFLKNAYSFKYNAYSVFLYALTVLIIIEVYLIGIRGNFMGLILMFGSALATLYFTKNMLMILTNALVVPAMAIIVSNAMGMRSFM
jgi:hypothetical protein